MLKKSIHQAHQLDVALLLGLIELIKKMVSYTSLDMEFHELAIIAKSEKGVRRRVIRYIIDNTKPEDLGFPHVISAMNRSGAISAEIANILHAVIPCPQCKKGKLLQNGMNKKIHVCNQCGIRVERENTIPTLDDNLINYLTRHRKHQILSHWRGLNDPNAPRYGISLSA